MINLKTYLDYWESVADGVKEITGVLPVTLDKEMGKKILSLPTGSVTLFVLPPIAESEGRGADSISEGNQCVVFVMKKYSPQRQTSFDILAETQPVVDELKRRLYMLSAVPCSDFELDGRTVQTAPETELYGTFAGWSLAFILKTQGL